MKRSYRFENIEDVVKATDEQITSAWVDWHTYKYEPDEAILNELINQRSVRNFVEN